jgi:hypothetical protein
VHGPVDEPHERPFLQTKQRHSYPYNPLQPLHRYIQQFHRIEQVENSIAVTRSYGLRNDSHQSRGALFF